MKRKESAREFDESSAGSQRSGKDAVRFPCLLRSYTHPSQRNDTIAKSTANDSHDKPVPPIPSPESALLLPVSRRAVLSVWLLLLVVLRRSLLHHGSTTTTASCSSSIGASTNETAPPQRLVNLL